jgi:ubiquinone/menaquinone biosynthesis C-methylase UbiE
MAGGSTCSFDHPSRGFLIVDALFLNPLLAPLYRGFVATLGLRGCEDVLELGSGTGSGSRHLAAALRNGGRLTCVDTSGPLCGVAARRLRGFNNAEVLAGDIRSLGLPTASQDRVVIHFMLHDIGPECREETLAALAQILRPNGQLQIREPTKPSHGIPVDDLREFMRGAGLRELHGREHNVAMGLLGRVYTGVFEKESISARGC